MATFEIKCEEVIPTPPINLIFTHSKKRLKKLFRKFGIAEREADRLRANATTTFLEATGSDEDDIFIVYMQPCLEWSAAQDAGLLAHEATHIAQDYLASLGEDKPSPEFEAYIVGFVTQELVSQHFEWKKKRLADS
jgi:hypothetical protein